MWETIITIGLQLLGWFLNKNKEDKEMQELFYKFVEKQHLEYMNSSLMRDKAKIRFREIMEKPFVETT